MPENITYTVSYTDHTGTQSILGTVTADSPQIALLQLGKFVRLHKETLNLDGDVCLITEEGGVVGGSESKVGHHLT